MAEQTKKQNGGEDVAENEVSHGNLGLPFGLCKKHGIAIGKDWTPRDAWAALAGKGVFPPWTEKGKNQHPTKRNKDKTAATPTKSKQFKNRAQAEEFLQKNIATDVNFIGVTNDESIQTIAETIKNVFDKYGFKKIQRVEKNARLRRALAQANGGVLEYDPKFLNQERGVSADRWEERKKENKKDILEFAEKIQTDPRNATWYKKHIKRMEEELKYDRWTIDGEKEGQEKIKGATLHELGHLLADQKSGQINRSRFCPEYKTDPTNKCYLANKNVRQAYAKALSNGDIYKISMYASSDEYEFFAESFCAMEMGEKLPDYIVSAVKGVLEL